MSFSASISGHVPQPLLHSGAGQDEIDQFDAAQKAAVDKENELFADLRAVADKHRDVIASASFYGSHVQGSLLSPVEEEAAAPTEEAAAADATAGSIEGGDSAPAAEPTVADEPAAAEPAVSVDPLA